MERTFSTLALVLVAPLFGTSCSPSDSDPGRTPPGQTDGAEAPIVIVAPDVAWGSGEAQTRTGNLDRAVTTLEGPTQLHLQPGHYYLEPEAFRDPSCGNCEVEDQVIPGTVGLILTGQDLTVFGDDADSVVIHTGAGYGILFQDCKRCVLRGVMVTDGVRDPDPRATNGAVVARASSLILQRCRIKNNVGDPQVIDETVVGIAGVVGREDSRLAIRTCRIEGNSWDGIALYRGSEAIVRGNTIDGTPGATRGRIGGGRGVGIGVTWNARAVIEENLVRRYWKGIGIFGDAHAEVRENVIEDMSTWGIALWSKSGSATAFVEHNVVFRTGACGILVDLANGPAEPGIVSGNALVATTRDPAYDSDDPYCRQQPLARMHVPDGWETDGNLFHENRVPGPAGDTELDLATFTQRAMSLYTFHIEPQAATTHSAFMDEFKDAFGPPFR